MEPAAPSLLPVLRSRVSPSVFDPAHAVAESEVEILLEAARWAPSAGNSQPWAFHVRRRGAPGHDVLVDHLAGSARRWAPDAGLLIVNLAHRTVGGSTIEYSEFAEYDLGQAVAHLTIQAHAMGLGCRQFRAFDLAGLEQALGVARGWKIVTMTAVGVGVAHGDAPRDRRSVASLRHDGRAQPGSSADR